MSSNRLDQLENKLEVLATSLESSITNTLLELDFDCGHDSYGKSTGELCYEGADGFKAILTADESDGNYGGLANGVHITNTAYGNRKVGTSDFVLGANNDWINGDNARYNDHSSGIVARFSHGATSVRFADTDDDGTVKILYAFDQCGKLIGQTAAGSRKTFSIDTTATGGNLIFSIEFDTLPNNNGGSNDGTYFTIDDLVVTGKVNNDTVRTRCLLPPCGCDCDRNRTLIRLNFNDGRDSFGRSHGELIFKGSNGFTVLFTDDDSNGNRGNMAKGAHISNLNYGNKKVNTKDLVLGAYNSPYSMTTDNYHSSGIVARFSHGVTTVGFDDTDDDSTTKSLYAFDEFGNQIAATSPGTQIPFSVDTAATGGKLIYAVEFDTLPGTAGGSTDGTVFTIDNFYVLASLNCGENQRRRRYVSSPSDFLLVDFRQLLFLDFNSGADHTGRSQGDLVFYGDDNFQVMFTDDDSAGATGGNADGVHISNEDYGSDKQGTDDLVLGAYNTYTGSYNYHTSGIVALFSHGVFRVSLEDTDDDGTLKTLFAFDEFDEQIGKTAAGAQKVFRIDTTMTGGKLIFGVEFDTQVESDGGSNDGTFFTIDNFRVEGTASEETARSHY